MSDRSGLSRKKRGSLVAGTLAAILSFGTAAQACLNDVVPDHTLALSVRTLQSDLMVSALSCNERARYNGFAVQYRSELQTHGTALKAYFKKLHGGGANRELNTYVTDLANYAAVRHAEDANAFCGGTDSAFRALQLDSNADIQKVALAYAMRVSPSLKQEIALAASNSGCEVIARGSTVAAGGVTILD